MRPNNIVYFALLIFCSLFNIAHKTTAVSMNTITSNCEKRKFDWVDQFHFDKNKHVCYAFVNRHSSWNKASTAWCQEPDLQLPDFNQAVLTSVKDIVGFRLLLGLQGWPCNDEIKSKYWVGAHVPKDNRTNSEKNHEDKFVWLDGTKVDQSLWDNSQPHKHESKNWFAYFQCRGIDAGLRYHNDHNLTTKFICEQRTKDVASCSVSVPAHCLDTSCCERPDGFASYTFSAPYNTDDYYINASTTMKVTCPKNQNFESGNPVEKQFQCTDGAWESFEKCVPTIKLNKDKYSTDSQTRTGKWLLPVSFSAAIVLAGLIVAAIVLSFGLHKDLKCKKDANKDKGPIPMELRRKDKIRKEEEKPKEDDSQLTSEPTQPDQSVLQEYDKPMQQPKDEYEVVADVIY